MSRNINCIMYYNFLFVSGKFFFVAAKNGFIMAGFSYEISLFTRKNKKDTRNYNSFCFKIIS